MSLKKQNEETMGLGVQGMFDIVEEHYRKNRNAIIKKISFKAGSPQDAEDIVQEAYTRALTYIHAYNPNEFQFERWFSRLFQNVWKDFLEVKYQRGHPEEVDEKDYVCLKFESNASQLMELVYDEIFNTENQDHREILTLYLIYGYKLKDVSNIMGMRSGTVNQVLFRFKEDLKKTYS